jgi:hypothetical protein
VLVAASAAFPQIFVRPREIDTVLLNPGMGFTTFQRFNGDETLTGTAWTEGFPIDYSKPVRPGFRNEAHPQSTVAYWRVYWRFLEPEEGKYRWDLVDQALATARSRGQSLMLRVAPYGTKTADRDIPDWLRKQAGPSPPPEKTNIRIDPESDLYRRNWTRFISALAKKYDGHPDMDSVDVSLAGAWGEGEGVAKLPQQVVGGLMDAYLDGFRSTPMLMQLVSPWANRYALSKRSPSNVGWRADCLGDYKPKGMGSFTHMIDAYPRAVVENGVSDAWKNAPVSFEACWVMQFWKEQGWDLDRIIEQSLKWHMSTFNNKSSRVPVEWNAKVDGWLKKMGYRLVLRMMTLPKSLRLNEPLDLRSVWENKGVAPCYRAYALALRFGNGGPVLMTKADVRKWLPGDSIHDESLTLPSTLKPGLYDISYAIVDPKTHAAKVQLGIEGRMADGWYPAGRMQVLAPKTTWELMKERVRKSLP